MSSKKKESPKSTALAPIKMVTSMVQNGLVAGNDGAITYITSIRRRQLREQREKCDVQIKSIVKKQEELMKQINDVAKVAAVANSKEWSDKLNEAFAASGTPLVALADFDSMDTKAEELVVNRTIDKKKTSDEEEHRYGYGTLYSKKIRIPIPADIKALNAKIEALTEVKSETEAIAVKVQRELHDLPNIAQDAQAAIFAQAMKSDANGKAVLAALDAKLDEMPGIPDLPTLPTV